MVSLLFSLACNAATIEERAVGLADGDTVTVLNTSKVQHKIRLSGIDAPEKNQACRGHERLLTGVELDNRNAASGERQQRVFKSRPLGKLGWPLAIFDDDLNFKLATLKLTVRLAISIKKQES